MKDSDMVIVIEQNFLSKAINKNIGKVVEVYTKITSYMTSDLKKAIDYLISGQNSTQTSCNISSDRSKS